MFTRFAAVEYVEGSLTIRQKVDWFYTKVQTNNINKEIGNNTEALLCEAKLHKFLVQVLHRKLLKST